VRFPLWANPGNNPSATAERFLTIEGVMNWSTSNVTGRYPIPPGGGTIRKLKVFLGIAPGAGKGWRASYVLNGVEVEATRVKIEGAGVLTGEWKGELKVKEGDTLQILLVPISEPALPGFGIEGTAFYTTVETVGNVFWIGGGGSGNINNGTTSFNPPFGINSAGWGNEGLTRIVVPLKCKLKGIAFDLSGTAGTSEKSYTLSMRVNGAKDVLPAKVEGAGTSALATGSAQVEPGETLEAKCSALNEPTGRSGRYSLAIESEAAGEIFAAGMNEGADSASAEQSTYPDTWKLSWVNVANGPLPRPTGLKIERLYLQIGIAPGVGKSRTYVLTLNAVAQALKVKVEGEATSGNDVTHSFTTTGAKVGMLATPAGTPAADTGGVHWGFVIIVPQPVELEASLSGAGSISAELRPTTSLSGSLAGEGSVTAPLRATTSFVAQVSGEGSIAGTLGYAASMGGSLSGAGSLGADLNVPFNLEASLSGSGAISAELRGVAPLAAAAGGEGIVSAPLGIVGSLDGALSGEGSISADLQTLVVSLEASLGGEGIVEADLSLLASLAASLAGEGVISAEALEAIVALAAALGGSGSIEADLGVRIALAAKLVGEGALVGLLAIAAPEIVAIVLRERAAPSISLDESTLGLDLTDRAAPGIALEDAPA